MKKRTVLILGISLIAFIIISVASIIYTEQPKFCISCHIMKPYYASWKESAHKEINCLECHYEPNLKAHIQGKLNGLVQVAQYLTHRYDGRPNAQISDETCLREGCHKREELKNKQVQFYNKVGFSHATHFDTLRPGIQLRCTSCHMQLTSDKHIAVEKEVCFSCHFKNIPLDKLTAECFRCHPGIKDDEAHKEFLAPIQTPVAETSEPPNPEQAVATVSLKQVACVECHSDAKKGEADVDKHTCFLCHSEKEKVEKIKDYNMMHKVHIKEHKVDCLNCHGTIAHN